MSQKRNNKKNSNYTQSRRVGENPNQLQEGQRTKRFDSRARNILYTDLVILAASQMLYSNKVIGEVAYTFVSIIGTLLLLLAMYLQFGKKSQSPKPPRL